MRNRTHRFVETPPDPITYLPDTSGRWYQDEANLCSWRNCGRFYHRESAIALCSVHYDMVIAEHTKREDAERARRNDPTEPTGSVYYVEIDGLIKIGYANDVRKRMRAYPPTAKLLAVEPGSPALERIRHDHFHAYLARGREWFRDASEVRDWIATARAEHGSPHHMAHQWTGPRDTVGAGARRTTRR